MTGPMFDAAAFARDLSAAVARAGGMRRAAVASGVSAPTISRACAAWPTLSHENHLRLTAWMARQQEGVAA